jgi:hypothetical protein
MKNLKYFLPVLCLFLLTACAGPVTMSPQGSSLEVRREAALEKEIAYKKIIGDQDRVFNVSFPILSDNADFCGKKTGPAFGLTAWNIETVKPEFRRAAAYLYNLQDRLAVQYVADRSPAARAGVKSGDFIVAILGQSIPPGKEAIKTAANLLKRGGYKQADILLERKGQLINAPVTPVEACDYPVLLDSQSNDINAFADGKRIVISKGILRMTENDNELALVVAHELGHLAMRHIDKQQENVLAGTLGGFALDSLLAAAGVSTGSEFSKMGRQLGAQAHSVAFEQEADYVGMYFMERAGYNSSGVAHFWRRMAAELPQSVSIRGDHPTSPERFIAIERTRDEIVRKKTSRQSLVPNFKPE